MSTALQLVNKVLRRLREDEVTSFSASYTNLILDFINEAKQEVEGAWDWTALRTTKTITTVAGTRQYTLTGAGSRFRILYDHNKQPMVYNVTNGGYVSMGSAGALAAMNLNVVSSGVPFMFAITGQDSSGDPVISFESVPDGVYEIRFHICQPQADLASVTDTMSVEELPVILGAWAKGISERGEDGGQNTIEQQMMYKSALSDAIARDESKNFGETTWQLI